MKKIIAIFSCLFFNFIFSSSYDECMKKVQNFRLLNHKTQTILRGHAAEKIADMFEKSYSDATEITKSLPRKTEPKDFVKNSSSRTMNNEESVNHVKMLTMKIKEAFDRILKRNLSFNHSIIELEKSKEYRDLIAKYPVVEQVEYKYMLHSILVKQYQSYYLSFIAKNTK